MRKRSVLDDVDKVTGTDSIWEWDEDAPPHTPAQIRAGAMAPTSQKKMRVAQT